MKNWKTSLIGALTGSASIALNAYQNGSFTFTSLIPAIGIFLLGLVSKDHDSF